MKSTVIDAPTIAPASPVIEEVPLSDAPPAARIVGDSQIGVGASINLDAVEAANQDRTPDERTLILWLAGHAKTHNIAHKRLAHLLGQGSKSVISRLFNGRPVGHQQWDNIRLYRDRVASHGIIQAGDGASSFVVTTLARQIWNLIEAVRMDGRMGIGWGESQAGKTAGILEWIRLNPVAGIYLSMPPSPTLTAVATRLGRKVGLNNKSSTFYHREASADRLNHTKIIIVDEAHQCFQDSCTRRSAIAILEWLRSLHDDTGCQVVLIGTSVVPQHLVTDDEHSPFVQIFRRCDHTVALNTRPTQRDLHLFWGALGMPDPDAAAQALVQQIVAAHGLGKLLSVVKRGIASAERQGEPRNWDRVADKADSLIAQFTPRRRGLID